jgi:hypothetical protein
MHAECADEAIIMHRRHHTRDSERATQVFCREATQREIDYSKWDNLEYEFSDDEGGIDGIGRGTKRD